MQIGLIADADIRYSDKHPAVNRLEVLAVPAVRRYAASAEGPDEQPGYAGRPTIRR